MRLLNGEREEGNLEAGEVSQSNVTCVITSYAYLLRILDEVILIDFSVNGLPGNAQQPSRLSFVPASPI